MPGAHSFAGECWPEWLRPFAQAATSGSDSNRRSYADRTRDTYDRVVKRLLMLTTGGTIVGNVAGSDLLSTERLQGALADVLRPSLEAIAEHWGQAGEAEISMMPIANLDSSDIDPSHWSLLAQKIKEEYDAYDGFIITHGTNTMGYTCAALTFALPNLAKPVVVTGSQLPHGALGSDALMNLANAVRIALYPYEGGVRGVVCVFGGQIITGMRVKKRTEIALDAFQPASGGRLGTIGRIIQMNTSALGTHHRYLSAGVQPPAIRARDLVLDHVFTPDILSFTECPGLPAELLIAACKSALREGASEGRPRLRAVIWRAFGAGDVSSKLHPALEYLRDHEIPVVVSTQMPEGVSNLRVNEPGMQLAKRGLGIPSHDMSIEALTTKTMWLLGKDCSYGAFADRLLRDLHGEVTVLRDDR